MKSKNDKKAWCFHTFISFKSFHTASFASRNLMVAGSMDVYLRNSWNQFKKMRHTSSNYEAGLLIIMLNCHDKTKLDYQYIMKLK